MEKNNGIVEKYIRQCVREIVSEEQPRASVKRKVSKTDAESNTREERRRLLSLALDEEERSGFRRGLAYAKKRLKDKSEQAYLDGWKANEGSFLSELLKDEEYRKEYEKAKLRIDAQYRHDAEKAELRGIDSARKALENAKQKRLREFTNAAPLRYADVLALLDTLYTKTKERFKNAD